MYELNTTIKRNGYPALEDSRKTKKALNQLGYLDDEEKDNPYPNNSLFSSIQSFQSDHGLKKDGVIKPNGETAQTIRRELQKPPRKPAQKTPPTPEPKPNQCLQEKQLVEQARKNVEHQSALLRAAKRKHADTMKRLRGLIVGGALDVSNGQLIDVLSDQVETKVTKRVPGTKGQILADASNWALGALKDQIAHDDKRQHDIDTYKSQLIELENKINNEFIPAVKKTQAVLEDAQKKLADCKKKGEIS